MTALSDAPPFGASPTLAAQEVWTGTTNVDKLVQTLINLNLEEQLRNPLPFLLDGNYLKAEFVKGSNGTMRFLGVGDLSVDVSASSAIWVLKEGEPNPSVPLSIGYEEFTVAQAMQTVRLTDVAMDISPIALIRTGAEKLARWVLEVSNAIAAQTILAGANTYFIGTDGSPTNAEVRPDDVLTGAGIRGAVAELDVTNVPTFADQTYRGFLHPYVKLDLQGDTDDGGWIDAHRYANPAALLTGEIGSYAGVRFIKSNTGKVANAGSSSNDVFYTPVIGPGSFALGDFGGGATYMTPPGGHDDPGHQSALMTWIGFLGGMVVGEGANATGPVSDARYINIVSGSSKSTS